VEFLQAYSAPLEGRRGMLRLDFNENTVGPSPKVVQAIRAMPAEHYAIYPEYDGIQAAVAASLLRISGPVATGRRLEPRHIGLFNGVDAALHAVFQAYGAPGNRLLTTSPTFGYYSPCARMQGMVIEAIPYRQHDFAFPFEEIRAALTGPNPDPPMAARPQGAPQGAAAQAAPPQGDADLVSESQSWVPPRLLLICNPNNPTGTRLAPERILELAAVAPATLVVVDELYEAFSGDSVLPLLLAGAGGAAAAQAPGAPGAPGAADPFAAFPNLLVLRSLSKTAGLAGLRIGFAIGHPAVVDRIGRVTGPYDINSLAVTAAYAALDDQAYVDDFVAEVLTAKALLQQRLTAGGWRHQGEGGNYLLLWPRARGAAVVEQRLRDAGILVRSMAGKPLIDGSLRVSIGTCAQMEQFWSAWQQADS
jgi:histidinol-phosphate aminotransferase